jgi:hypothetical protein
MRTCPFNNASVYRRRRISRLLDRIIAELHPPVLARPSTFGLEPDALLAEAQRLHNAGWSVDEVNSVLAITPNTVS